MIRKLFASIIASFLMLAVCSGAAFADSPGETSDEDALLEAANLVHALQGSDLSLDQFGIAELDTSNLFLGSSIPVYDVLDGVPAFSGMQYWPIYSANRVVAVVIACPSDNGTTFVLSVDSVSMLDKFLKNNDQVAIVKDDGEFYFCSPLMIEKEGESPSVEGSSFSYSHGYNIEYSVVQSKTSIVLDDDLDIFEVSRQAATSNSVTLSVKTCWQGNDPTCWSASVAVMADYLTGIWKTPASISNAIKGEVAGGTDRDVMAAFGLYTYPGTNTGVASKTLAQPVPHNQVLTWIDNGMPIYAHCINFFSGFADHAVTVLGYTTGTSSGTTLFIMNSGTGSYEIASKGPEDLYYSFPYNKTSYVWRYSSVVLTGWQKPYRGDTWRYYESNGNVATGWRSIDGTWYCFASNGDIISNSWFQDGGIWYYLNESGAMTTGWRQIEGSWYYFNASGAMLASQWLLHGGNWYYLSLDGAALTGWHSLEGYWYSFDDGCRMRHGWFFENNTWYYLRTGGDAPVGGPEGSMLANGSWHIGGKTYHFDSSGGCINP